MPSFFTGPVGRVAACTDEHAEGTATFIKTDPALTWSSQKSIITRITVSQQGNYQFLHTIGNDVYVYVFGDRMGSVTISGLSMTVDCTGGTRANPGFHGFELIMKWYQENRVAMRREPVQVNIGQTFFLGFVVGLTGDVVDPATRIMQYGLQLVTLPEKK